MHWCAYPDLGPISQASQWYQIDVDEEELYLKQSFSSLFPDGNASLAWIPTTRLEFVLNSATPKACEYECSTNVQ
jgi:hypothetical protein